MTRKGHCLDIHGKQQNVGKTTIATGVSEEECLKQCLGQSDPYSQGCEYNKGKASCVAHSKFVITGKGSGDETCYVLTGPTFQSIFPTQIHSRIHRNTGEYTYKQEDTQIHRRINIYTGGYTDKQEDAQKHRRMHR